MKTFIILFFFIAIVNIRPQSDIELEPDDIEFEDIFNRLENVLIINEGDENLVIDTILYNSDFYFLRFDQEMNYPVTVIPGDTIEMNVLLSGYFLITSQDTSDEIKILHSGNLEEDLEIEVDFFDDDDIFGNIEGRVTDKDGPLPNTKLYFYYDGNFLLGTANTNANGEFNKQLPEGNYTIAAEKKGYYFTFYNGRYDPYDANKIFIKRDSEKKINFNLIKKIHTPNKVLGKTIDYRTRKAVKDGIIVVRKGKHTPSKLTARAAELADIINSYTVKLNSDGSFTVDDIIEPGYYYIQAFSDFYLPAYTTHSDEPVFFWHNTNSTLIQNTVESKNIILKRDSSYGGGIINGSISVIKSNPNDSIKFSDILILANNIDFNELTYYTISGNDGSFTINHLPYGRYKLIAQSIGYNDALSDETFEITPQNTEINNAKINILLTSVWPDLQSKNDFILFQNYPNPFNPSTIIRYSIPDPPQPSTSQEEGVRVGFVTLKVYDILGKEVAILVNKNQIPGNYFVEFNSGNLSSGVYYYQLRVDDNFVQTKKMILLR